MNLTPTINAVELVWVLIALFGLVYGLIVRSDARADVKARIASGINGGRDELARLLVTTSSLLSFALFIFLLAGLFAMALPGNPKTTPQSYGLQGLLVLAEAAISFTLYYKQRVRRRVLRRDMARLRGKT